MKTLKEYFEKYSDNPEFEKKVWKMGDVDWKDFKDYPNDYIAANTGAVPGCIYYEDTVKFAKRNLVDILTLLRKTELDLGKLNVPEYEDDDVQYYNWLTWFAWETLAYNLMCYLEV